VTDNITNAPICSNCFYFGDTSIVNIKSILDLPPKSSVDFLYVCTRL